MPLVGLATNCSRAKEGAATRVLMPTLVGELCHVSKRLISGPLGQTHIFPSGCLSVLMWACQLQVSSCILQ